MAKAEAVPRHHKPLNKRFHARLSDEAYANLRLLAHETGLGNNYVLTVLLENLEETVNRTAFKSAVSAMLERHQRE